MWYQISGSCCFGFAVAALLRVAKGNDLPVGELLAYFVGAGVLLGLGVYLWKIGLSREMTDAVASLVPIPGKSLAAVVGALGRPAASVATGEETVMTWTAPGYSLALAFRDGVCVRVVKETATRIR